MDTFIKDTAMAYRVKKQGQKAKAEHQQKRLMIYFIEKAKQEKVLESWEINQLNSTFGDVFVFTKKALKEMDDLYKAMYKISFATCFRKSICARCKGKMDKPCYTYICDKCYRKLVKR